MDAVKFAFHVIGHPFDGFWDLKRERKGRFSVAFGILLLVIVSNICNKKLAGFLFNESQLQSLNLMSEITTVLGIYLLFCVANWSITTLMDGEGKFREILMTVGYALLPIPLIQIPVALLTNIATYSEATYISALYAFSYIWCFFLLFTGLMTVHQYSILKMVFTVVLTVVAIACILFLGLLFVHLFSQMYAFIMSLFKELRFRN